MIGLIISAVICAAAGAFGGVMNWKEKNGEFSQGHASHSSKREDGARRRKHSHKCDGNCANCPAHYGYRYGRWYYGHGHQHGCERGGNGGASGKCYRD